MEGRALDISDIADTDYWSSRTPAQREFETFVLQNGGPDSPAVQQKLDTNRVQVRDLLIQAGYENPPESMINYLADQLTTGAVNATQLQDMIKRETDPFAAGASPFAGRDLPEGAELVRMSDGSFAVSHEGQFYGGIGEGQLARFGGEDAAKRALSGGAFFQVEGTDEYYFQSVNGTWYSVRGPGSGQYDQMVRLFGEATVAPREHIGAVRAPLVGTEASPFKPGELENVVGVGQVTGSTSDLIGSQEPFEGGQSALGGVEAVRQLLVSWLGPYFAKGYSQQWLEEWAGKIRQNPNAEEQLIDVLRSAKSALFPGYAENARYVDFATPWAGVYAQYAGQTPNEEDDALFLALIQANDPEYAQETLWNAGFEQGWGPVADQAHRGLQQQLGGQVRGSVV
jgi:hypothetical protein